MKIGSNTPNFHGELAFPLENIPFSMKNGSNTPNFHGEIQQ
jgi:hypothetical protein